MSLPGATPLILIVDDDPGIRSVLARFLERKGYQVRSAANGKEALKVLADFDSSLVLLDVDMPVMDGPAALLEIRRAFPRTAVMMISGGQDVETAKRCMELGACDYILKPLDFEYLEMSVWAKILTLAP